MKRSKFNEAQISFILRQSEEGTAVGEICRKAGISEATFYNWKNEVCGVDSARFSFEKLNNEHDISKGTSCK
jgi:transposase-like protein